jgi:metal transporter CNNM
MDGADECSAEIDTVVKKDRIDYTASSYTQNIRGGFHGADDSSSTVGGPDLPEELGTLGQAPPPTPVDISPKGAASLPSRKGASPFLLGEWNPFTRRYVSAMPNLPTVRRVTPFSREECSSFEEKPDAEQDGTFLMKHDETELIMPNPSMHATLLDRRFDANISSIDISGDPVDFDFILDDTQRRLPEDSSDTISISSLDPRDLYDIDDVNSRMYSQPFVTSTISQIHGNQVSSPARVPRNVDGNPEMTDTLSAKPYDGFPLELLENPRENQVPDFASKTLPRTLSIMGRLDSSKDKRDGDTPVREGSFHDDRALLPSQKRALDGSAGMNIGGLRSTSFYF